MYPADMANPSNNDDRAERLAAALRENLKSRKAQARAQDRIRQDGAKTEAQPPKTPSK